MALTVQFYHLTSTPLERALPKLLEKAVAAGYRVLLVGENDHQLEKLDQLLWTYDPDSFLPHGTIKGGSSEKQPILINSNFESPNGANLLAIINGAMSDKTEQFDRIIDMFDGKDQQAVENARNRWKKYKDQGHSLSYLRQTESGGWEQKAN